MSSGELYYNLGNQFEISMQIINRFISFIMYYTRC